jgi:hypothetical protein
MHATTQLRERGLSADRQVILRRSTFSLFVCGAMSLLLKKRDGRMKFEMHFLPLGTDTASALNFNLAFGINRSWQHTFRRFYATQAFVSGRP